MSYCWKRLLLQNQLFHSVFCFIGKLKTLCGEEFNAIMLKRIMRCRDHNACVGPLIHRKIRNCRRRYNTQLYNIRTTGAKSGSQRIFQHWGRNAGIHADQNQRLFFRCLLQGYGSSLTDPVSKLTSKIHIHDTANTVRTKQLCHKVPPL